jgi:hypothetical protein
MYIVIQEIQLKKPNKNGAYKEFKVDTISFSFNGITKTHYYYNANYAAGRFERLHLEAYKISLRESYREDGMVKAKQCVIATIGYYQLADDFWPLYDLIESGLSRVAGMFSDTDNLYDLVEAKIKPLRERIKREYHKTDEYKTIRERDKVQKKYQKVKAAFAKKYSVDADEYDCCYDIFGHVMEPDYLAEIIKKANAYSSYSNYSSGNYSYSGSSSGGDYSSYLKSNSSNYTEEEKQALKKFYKKLAMEFHPDRNPDTDTTKEMQLINKLKDEWNL